LAVSLGDWLTHVPNPVEVFQFLGIPPKGEQVHMVKYTKEQIIRAVFQFLGIPPKGEQWVEKINDLIRSEFSNF
jgi:hypothetical protein